jgi:hypothetical protein
MPPARRRSGAKQDAANTAVEDTTTEAEATEGEDEGEEDEKPARAPRTPKTYTVVNAELANSLVGEDFDEINEGDAVTGEMLDSMRSNKAKWDSPEDGGIKHVFGSNSAIPLRNIYNKWVAAQDEDNALSLDDVDGLYDALISGEGWVKLAARCGDDVTPTQVREALKDKVMEEHDVDITEGGRAYGKGENWTWVSAEQLNEAKAANGNGSDEDEDEDEESDEDTEASSDDDDTEDDESTEEEAPAPRRRRRAPTQ